MTLVAWHDDRESTLSEVADRLSPEERRALIDQAIALTCPETRAAVWQRRRAAMLRYLDMIERLLTSDLRALRRWHSW